MLPVKKFNLTVALVTLVLFGTLLAACSELSSVNLAAASASRPLSDDPATVTPAGLPVITPLATVEQEIELKGVIGIMAGNTITVNGQTFTLAPDVLAQRGRQLKVGSAVELKARLISGVLTVVGLVVEDPIAVETPRSTPTSAATATPGTTSTPAAGDDQNDDHGRDGQGQSQSLSKGKKDDTQPDDHGKDGATRAPTAAPTKTAQPARTVATTAKAPGSNSNKGSSSPEADDNRTRTVTASPTQAARQPSATVAPRTTEAGDDKGQDNSPVKVEDKTRPAATATPRPSEAGDDRGGKGQTDDTTRPPTARPTEKASTSTPKPVQTTDDRGGKGKGESGDDKGGGR